MECQFLSLPDGRLAYQRFIGDPTKPGVMFLGGFGSDLSGTKATFLAETCRENNISFTAFDYSGCGKSTGDFARGTISRWLENARAIFDQCTSGAQILVGSSMGGWISLLLARERRDRIRAFVGVAAAPDFTEDLIWSRMTEAQRAQLVADGLIYDEQAADGRRIPITLELVENGRQHLMLQKQISVNCSVSLIHGLNDIEVPWQHSLRILECLATSDVRLHLIKDGDHRLNRPDDLNFLWDTVKAFNLRPTVRAE